MRTVHRHSDELQECLAVVKTAADNAVPTMFAAERLQTLAVQLVCTFYLS